MKTLTLAVDPQKPDIERIRRAAALIRRGGLVAFPTETVYGLGANALNEKAILALFEAKKRPLDNPPITHICCRKDVHKLVQKIPSNADKIMRKFWPGPLTLVLERSEAVPAITVAGLSTIAIRMPKHNVALALIKESGCPIAAPSANLAGKPSPTSAAHVLQDLNGRINAVLDAGPTQIGLESTVLDLTVSPPEVLRPGGTPYEDLVKALGRVKLSPVVVASKTPMIGETRSPGMKHRHYAPNAPMTLVEGKAEDIVRKVSELALSQKKEGKKVAVLATDETISRYQADVVKSMGTRRDLSNIAQNLFKALREIDLENVDAILAEGVPSKGLWLAVINRLRKASGYRIVKT